MSEWSRWSPHKLGVAARKKIQGQQSKLIFIIFSVITLATDSVNSEDVSTQSSTNLTEPDSSQISTQPKTMLVDTHVPTNAFPAGLVAAASSNIGAGVVTCLATFVKRTIEHTLSSSSSTFIIC